ncbi:MAG: Asp-tRNA(Asn)/Glu-tRNA(Gln) amidotransferase subunit GatB [Desulfovibrionales bacterium]|nr:Asp-tRNA(Asn)/Glu-tRNA(Gln) amidotransferase subunit GatB [Desulfovibrionales bacterium]
MADFEVVIGLEVHAQLKTESKLFCSCSTRFGSEPNENVCEVCSGMPGALPVLNGKAVEFAAKMGLAMNCHISLDSIFERKNYFYPDSPNGYQISQLDNAICQNGHIEIPVGESTKRVGITRIQLENDAGKSIHSAAENRSYVDFNRTGVPLIEIVSDPDMRSAEEAVSYLKTLHSILLYLGICDGNMEEGSFRCDANVSLRPRGQEEFGTRVELKNMNSFRNVQRGIEYEIARQEDLILDGEAVVQETRLYSAEKNITASMRGKEEAHDYRYFPDPDLIPVKLSEEQVAQWQSELPELPLEKRARFEKEFSLPEYDANLLTQDRAIAEYFEASVQAFNNPKKLSNFLMGQFMRELNERNITVADIALAPEHFAELVRIVEEGMISTKIGNDVLPELMEKGGSAEALVKAKGMVQISDSSELEGVVDEVIAENPAEAEAYRGGKKKLQSFFVGQVMRKTRGKANPALVNELLQKKL